MAHELRPDQVRVSSVLNKNVKDFGKKNLFDDRDDTCWNSDPGRPQWVKVTFEHPVTVAALEVTFQGGFAGKECCLKCPDGKPVFEHAFYPEDTNKPQRFVLPEAATGQIFVVQFSDSTDFFGRITLYSLKFLS